MPRALARGEDSKNKSMHPRSTERPRRGRAGTGAQPRNMHPEFLDSTKFGK
jgi:hypothetical protein